jgi:hypothetical protein
VGGTGGASIGGAGAQGGTGGTHQGGIGGDAGTAGALPDLPDCALAVLLDECCSVPRPVSRAEFEADECYVEVRSYVTAFQRETRCEVPPCLEVVCPAATPPSRIVKLDNSGQCVFSGECSTNADCVLTKDTSRCCGCPTAFPKALVDEFMCLQAAGSTSGEVCNACETVDCDGCGTAPDPADVVCLAGDAGQHTCGFAPPPESGVTENQCTGEHACVVGSSPGITCYAPGEPYCAGPPPPPDECADDSTCAPDGSAWICEPVGHCQSRECVVGCTDDDECSEWELCGTDHRCIPKPCPADPMEGFCAANHLCVDGYCARRTCATSSDCDGYCVKGVCYELPGNCYDALAP